MEKEIISIKRHDGKKWVELHGIKKFLCKIYIKIFGDLK